MKRGRMEQCCQSMSPVTSKVSETNMLWGCRSGCLRTGLVSSLSRLGISIGATRGYCRRFASCPAGDCLRKSKASRRIRPKGYLSDANISRYAISFLAPASYASSDSLTVFGKADYRFAGILKLTWPSSNFKLAAFTVP